jgi:protein-S-isoprenylcysteine O-methyltransferase Ste14
MEEQKLNRKPHEGREDLTGEHKMGDAGQVILFLLFFIVWIVDCFFYDFSAKYFQDISLLFRLPIAIIVFGLSGYLAKASLKIVFDEVRDKPEVINKGVFRYIRHPMYLAAILLYLSLLIFKMSFAALLVWIVTLLFYHFIASYEEKLLLEQFGEEYEKYKQSVSMWFPKSRKGIK